VPLSADQQAMLQLLLERGQSYGDLGSLLGIDEAEVRTRARAALTELAGADPDRDVGLTDYLLGEADPIGRADAVRHLKDHPEDLDLARELAQKLRLIAPEAELPRLPGEERRPRARRARHLPTPSLPIPRRLRRASPPDEDSAGADSPRSPRTTLSRRQTQFLVALGSGAVLLVAVILGVTGAFGGGGNGDDTATTASTSTPTQRLTRVKLQAASGSEASGTAIFGLANGSVPFADVKLSGLKPAPSGQAYVVWLLLTPTEGYPLAPIQACSSGAPQPCLTKSGSYHTRSQIPPAVIPVVARVQLVDISLAPINTVRDAIKKAIQQKHVVIQKPGTTVLQGAIPKPSGGG
jgi:hypothetical protein